MKFSLKKILTGFLLLSCLLLAFIPNAQATDTEEYNFDYIIHKEEGTVTIIGCPSSVTELNIPAEIDGYPVTEISAYAFNQYSGLDYWDYSAHGGKLEQVTLPDSIVRIGAFAFCENKLVEINIPSNLQEIGAGAFSNNQLTKLELPDGLLKIGDYAFCQNPLTELHLPDSITELGRELFGYTDIEEIVLPPGLTELPYHILDNSNVKKLTIPEGITEIPRCAFGSDEMIWDIALEYIVLPSTLTSIGEMAFFTCPLKEIIIPDSVTYIGKNALASTDVERVVLPKGITAINDRMFYGCFYLTDITIPSTITSIGDDAFSYCSSLTDIVIPSTVTSIGNNAFSNCSSLTDIVIPESVETMGDYVFSYCRSIKNVQFPSHMTKINDGTFYMSLLKEYEVPDGIKEIGADAFGQELYSYNPPTPLHIIIPASVTYIDPYAFSVYSYYYAPDPHVTIGYYPGGAGETYKNNVMWSYDVTHTVHEYVLDLVYEPTCAYPGYKDYRCSCGNIYTEEIPMKDHTFSKWQVVYVPTVESAGSHERTCTYCNLTETEVLPQLSESFEDVTSDDWFQNAVAWASTNEITTGTSESTFSPMNPCTRAQVVTFLWRSAGKPEPTGTENPFSDVIEGEYYYKAVLWAVENGITNGMTATTFGTNEPCNRAQVVTFLWRTAGKPTPETTYNPFEDVLPDAYYYDAVLWAVDHYITTGITYSTFVPEGNDGICNRAQIVTFLYRYAMI